jgi:hypothetical protein
MAEIRQLIARISRKERLNPAMDSVDRRAKSVV